MPDNNRLDLGSELEKISGSFAADVNAAAAQVKQRQAADKAKEAKQADKAQSRKMSAVVIAVAAVVLLLMSYWIVFGQGEGSDNPTSGANSAVRAPQPEARITTTSPTSVTTQAPQAPPKAYSPVGGGSSQTVEQPQDGYEQPGDACPGM